MCGITGFWDRTPARMEQSRSRLLSMTDALRHRGPDDSGEFLEEGTAVALGARRLAVVDLSAHGHQPMLSPDGRYVLAFNGEIYNFRSLRRDLESAGLRFSGSGDTEVVVAAVQHWGLPETLERCNGMFGLALWDRRRRQLHLALTGSERSRCTTAGPARRFSSAPSSRRCAPTPPSAGRSTVTCWRCISATTAFRRRIRSTGRSPSSRPRSFVTVDATTTPGTMPVPQAFWSLRATAEAGAGSRSDTSIDDATDELDATLGRAVATRTHADVALGAFVGWDRLVPGGGAHAGPAHGDGEDLHHRLRGRRL